MKNKRKYILVSFLVLTVINLAILFYRDKFAYHKIGTYSSLYSSDTFKWKQFVFDYPADELESAKNILDSSINIKGKTTANQVLEIGRMMYDRFNKQSGRPSAALFSLSPLQQYQILRSSDSEELWCGIYANMFAFFCWSKGIPCRIIEIMNPGDHHVVNECYLAESRQWAMVDLTYNQLLIWDKNNKRYLNFFDILKPPKGNFLSIQASENSILSLPFKLSFYDHYLNNDPAVYYYYRINLSEVYKKAEKIKRYLLPVSWYEEVNSYSGNFLFYVKEFFVLLWLVCFVILLAQIFKNGLFIFRRFKQ